MEDIASCVFLAFFFIMNVFVGIFSFMILLEHKFVRIKFREDVKNV